MINLYKLFFATNTPGENIMLNYTKSCSLLLVVSLCLAPGDCLRITTKEALERHRQLEVIEARLKSNFPLMQDCNERCLQQKNKLCATTLIKFAEGSDEVVSYCKPSTRICDQKTCKCETYCGQFNTDVIKCRECLDNCYACLDPSFDNL